MAIIEMVNGKLTLNNRPAKWHQWTLLVADLDGSSSGKGEGIRLPGALGGLPGGNSIESEEALFQKYEVRVEGAGTVDAPSGERVRLAVRFRAQRADELTGPGIRSKEVNPSAGEVNEVRMATNLVRDLVEGFTKDASASVGDLQRKDQRYKLAAALRALADAL